MIGYMKLPVSLFWFRQDLRLTDNPGLIAAAKEGLVLPIYIWDENLLKIGKASQWWLHHSLKSLDKSLAHKLNIYKGCSEAIMLDLIEKNEVRSVYWNRCYDPTHIQRDAALKQTLKNRGIACKSFNASLLWEPWEVSKNDGGFYKVYTPFYKHGCLKGTQPRGPLPMPTNATYIKDEANTFTLDQLKLVDSIPWHKEWPTLWNVGEQGAHEALDEFMENKLQGYKTQRDFPSKKHTSQLSPHLHFGEISPHQVWDKVQQHSLKNGLSNDVSHFLSELGWREFSYYLLYHVPTLAVKNFQKKFDQFPWKDNPQWLKAWQKGQTGYPIVDAGMRELWQTGYMHNRVRMIVASFLVKNLGMHWRHGAQWFWDCLVDADLANNSASWQWVAGSGADAAPYFRVFNPILQGEKFDGDGAYTRCFVPELAKLPQKYLFKPWQAPQHVLAQANVRLAENYPYPIVDIKESRDKALANYKNLKLT